jgi:hypothetical protein
VDRSGPYQVPIEGISAEEVGIHEEIMCRCGEFVCSDGVLHGRGGTGERTDGRSTEVLTVTREFLKPGKSGTLHDKTESAFVAAMRDAKWPSYYFGLDSLSGKVRSIFLTGYDSFDAWERICTRSRRIRS